MAIRNHIGEKYGRLTVLSFSQQKKGKSYWLCQCDCGNIKEVGWSELKNGNTKSCGCLRRENPIRKKIMNLSHTKLHKIYHNMKNRCLSPTNPRYSDYGGRGITLCEEWSEKYKGFLRFYDWAINNGYTEELTIDRIDNEKGYSPENCRWVDTKTQNRNTRKNIIITIGKETKCLKDWCLFFNVKVPRIYNYARRKKITLEESLLRAVTLGKLEEKIDG